MGVTTVLTILTLATKSTSQNEKHVDGKLTAMDIYIWACFVFVIFAMLEFALTDYTTYRRKEREMKLHQRMKAINESRQSSHLNRRPGSRDDGITNFNNNNDNFSTPTSPQLSPRSPKPTTSPHHVLLCQNNNCAPAIITECITHSGDCNSPLLRSPNVEQKAFQSINQSENSLMYQQGFRKNRVAIAQSEQTSKSAWREFLRDGRLLNNSARILFPICFVVFNAIYWFTLYILVEANIDKQKYDTSH